ncbi:MAG TPA: zinc-finger domain-containing protein [Caulobacteraceae bacterium]|nr:zinc-finger domain-containing protein [Caulobacteraceae bacterium]
MQPEDPLRPAPPPPEVIVVRSKRVACDGGGGALGHPLVYMDMGDERFVECGYCDRRFELAQGAEGSESEYSSPAPRGPEAH